MRTLVCAGLLLAMTVAWAQPQPTTEQMVEQLRPARTRSLRNLVVESATAPVPASSAPESPAAPPALSLRIQFEFDSAQILPPSQQALRKLADALQSPLLASARFAIEGHTDAQGRVPYNLALSRMRAQAVLDFLVSQGVAAPRLQAVGKGSTELADPQQPLAAANRRVRVVNLDP